MAALGLLLRTQDLRRLSETRKEWRGAVHQVAVLRPRSVHAPPTDVDMFVHDLISAIPTLQTFHRGRGRGLSMIALRAHAACHDRQQAEWANLVSALQEGKARQAMRLDLGIRWWQRRWRPRMVVKRLWDYHLHLAIWRTASPIFPRREATDRRQVTPPYTAFPP